MNPATLTLPQDAVNPATLTSCAHFADSSGKSRAKSSRMSAEALPELNSMAATRPAANSLTHTSRPAWDQTCGGRGREGGGRQASLGPDLWRGGRGAGRPAWDLNCGGRGGQVAGQIHHQACFICTAPQSRSAAGHHTAPQQTALH